MKTAVYLVITALLTSITLADTLWRQYGFKAAHTSYNSSETILNPSNVSDLTLLWTSDTFNAKATAPTLDPIPSLSQVTAASAPAIRITVCGAGCAFYVQVKEPCSLP